MSETYTLRLSKHNPIVSDEAFVIWLKENGHHVSLTDTTYNTINGISDNQRNDPQSLWVMEVLCGLLDAFEDALERAQQKQTLWLFTHENDIR